MVIMTDVGSSRAADGNGLGLFKGTRERFQTSRAF